MAGITGQQRRDASAAKLSYFAMKGWCAMRLKKEYIVHDTGSETILVPIGDAGWAGMVKGNKTLGAILGLLKEDTTETAIIDAMKERFDAPDDIIRRDVKKAIAELRKIGAIHE